MNKLVSLLSFPLLILGLQANAALIVSESTLESVNIATSGSATFDFTLGATDFFVADTLVNGATGFEVSDSAGDAAPVAASAISPAGNTSTSRADATASHLSTAATSSVSKAITAGDAVASTNNEMAFTVSGSGEVTLTFAYILYNDISGALGFGAEYAESIITISDSFGGFDERTLAIDGAPGDISDSDIGILTLTFIVDGFDVGALYMDSYAFASTGVDVVAVPTPATVWLFASALTVMAGVARRKKS